MFNAVGPKKALKMFLDYPGVYLTSIFTPFVFGSVSAKTKCGHCCSKGCSSGEIKIRVSFRYTYLNLLLMGIGSTFALYKLQNIRNLLRGTYILNDFPKSWIDEPLTLYVPVFIALVIFFYIGIGIFHLLETKNDWCSNCCLPFTKREEYGTTTSKEESIEFKMHNIV